MVSVVIVDSDVSESDEIENIIRRIAAVRFDNEWKIIKIKSCNDFEKLIENRHTIDILIFEVEGKIEYLARYRSECSKAILMLLASDKTSPMYYLMPGIKADSLVVRPCEHSKIKDRIMDVLLFGYEKRKNDCELFAMRCQEGITRVPIDEILYFEAREKKIFARTLNEEYGFYGTLTKLILELPQNFVRCHNGFIVNIDKTCSVKVSKGEILLEADITIPLSRGYRTEFRDKFKGAKNEL